MKKYKKFSIKKIFKLTRLCIGILMIFILSGCSILPKEEESTLPVLIQQKEIKYDTIVASKGEITKTLFQLGSIKSKNEKDLFFTYISGYLKSKNFREGDIVKKGDVLAEIFPEKLEIRIKEQEFILKSAQLDFENLKGKETRQNELKKSELNIELQQLKLEELKKELRESVLISPMDGVIIYTSNIKVGEKIHPYEKIFTIADPKNIEVEYKGKGAKDCKVGMKANLVCDGIEYKGEVACVHLEEDYAKDISPYLRIRFDESPNNCELGANVEMRIQVQSKKGVIVIPKNSVYNSKNYKFIQVLENGEKIQRYVETGLESLSDVEIINGLEEGELVVVK